MCYVNKTYIYDLRLILTLFLYVVPFQGCIRPSTVQHGSTNLTDTNKSLFPVGTVLQYNCDPGYLPIGRSSLTCTSLGYWSSEPPHCIHSDGKDKLLILLYAILSPHYTFYQHV